MTTNPTTETLGAGERELLDYIDAHEEQIVDLLRTLVGFRTPNPPGGNEAEAQSWVAARLEELGLDVETWDVLPGRPNVVGRLRGAGNGPTVVLNGHIDVCEDVLLERWSSDPYEAVVDGRDLVGRGASDMKSATASFLFALEALRARNMRLRGDVLIQSVIGEEAGEPGTRSAIERGHVGDLAIVGESSLGRALVACVGVAICRITVQSPETLHLSARKLTLNAGGALEGANCVEKMATRVIPALGELEREWAVFKTHPLIPAGSTSINVFRVEGGSNPFILPDRCVAYTTITYYPNERREDVQREVEERIAAAAGIDRWLARHPPVVEWSPTEHPLEFAAAEFDPDSEAAQALAQAILDARGLEPVWGGRSGITDAGWFSEAGIPAIVFGPGNMRFAHAVDERVHLDDVVGHCKATALFLLRYCGAAG
jgi:formylaminopyrimidine deformylase